MTDFFWNDFTMASKIYTGRLDQFYDEEFYIEFIVAISEAFDSEFTTMVFEDQTKTGLDCKPHYHFMIVTDASHDKIKKWMKKHEPITMAKPYASLKETDNFEKAMTYMLKQYDRHEYIPFTDMTEDQLKQWVDRSRNYNQQLELNTWQDHKKLIAEQIKKLNVRTRLGYIDHIYDYIHDWNHKETTKENQQITIPSDMRPTILYIEMVTLTKDEFRQRGRDDYSMFEMANINRNY